MNARTVYGGNYLRVTDLPARRVPTQIQAVEERSFKRDDGTEERKLVVTLRGLPKPLVLNRTNVDSIIDVVGSEETDDWVGKAITLLQAKVRFQGKATPCVRVEELGDAVEAATPAPVEVL